MDSTGIRFPPPLVFLGLLLIGLGAERMTGTLSFGLAGPVAIGAGAGLALAGAALIVVAVGGFRRAGTRPEPWQPSTAIVSSGVYRWTRNPMYLGMALIHAGLALALDAPLALLTVPAALIIVDRQVIAREERYLATKFGRPYLDYKASVRRWL